MNTDPLGAFDSLGRLNVVIEAPRGGACRYRFTGRPGGFEVCGLQPRTNGRARPSGKGAERETAWRPPPFDIGYIPQAYTEDGRRLEVVLLDDAPAAVGCVIPSRLIGIVLPKTQAALEGGEEGVLVAASALSARFSCIGSLEEIHSHIWEAIERYYREKAPGRESAVAWGPVTARRYFLKGLERGNACEATVEEPSVPQPLKIRVAPGALLES